MQSRVIAKAVVNSHNQLALTIFGAGSDSVEWSKGIVVMGRLLAIDINISRVAIHHPAIHIYRRLDLAVLIAYDPPSDNKSEVLYAGP